MPAARATAKLQAALFHLEITVGKISKKTQ